MTSTSAETPSLRTTDLGSLAVMAWSNKTPDGSVPYILACPLGDGARGPEVSSAAAGQLLFAAGLSVKYELVDAARHPSLPITLLVTDNAAVLTLPHLSAQFVPTPAWLAAVAKRGRAYLLFTTRLWPGGEPGDLETLTAFTEDQETLESAAHVLLPARSLRG
ncbi:hypothetical protein GCM10010129_41900 [Streptomyces fumigatiscleroticus]|nr:hypothetical protein GCM10010129_41900 [Streptomyces fumigatiscleroticus]